jgi:hypothetical protein
MDGKSISLKNVKGIDLLADIVECSKYSLNPFYGFEYGVHNDGHVLIAVLGNTVLYLHIYSPFTALLYCIWLKAEMLTPLSFHSQTDTFFGTMAALSASFRDISFGRWHTFINNVFERHKALLPEYPLAGVNE